MKLLFSEARPDYAGYVFPYAVWAFPEKGETPAALFEAGFLPSTRSLDRFYLCRHVRVALRGFAPSSENRRILRKGAGVVATLLPRDAFELTEARREFCMRYTREKFGPEGRSREWVDSLFAAPVTTHVLLFADGVTGADVGIATLYLEGDRMAFYYYAFYDLAHSNRSLGMHMMTRAVELLAARGAGHAYLGTCYSESALYKTQFKGCEFFNGVRWSADLAELKHLLGRQQRTDLQGHLLESREYLDAHLPGDLGQRAASGPFGTVEK